MLYFPKEIAFCINLMNGNDELSFLSQNMSNTSNETVLTLLSETESQIIGCLYLAITLFFALPYSACMLVMIKDESISKSPLYVIIFHMGLADLFQLIFSGCVSGMYSLTFSNGAFFINKMCSGFAEANWFVYMYLSQILAINRLSYVFFGVHAVQTIFSLRNTRIFIGICWFIGLIQFAIWCSPGFDFFYDASLGMFSIDENSPVIWKLLNVNLVIDITHAVMQITWYTLIYIRIKIKVNAISAETSNVRQSKADQRILLQAFMLCMSDIITILVWQLLGRLLTVNNYTTMKMLAVFTTSTWFLCAGSNAIVYLVFNRQIRSGVIQLIASNKCRLGGIKTNITTLKPSIPADRGRKPIVIDAKNMRNIVVNRA